MVKKIILLLLLLATNVFASNYVTQASGNFADPTIWTNNCAPFLSGDTWTISSEHTVTYTNNFYTTSYWGNSVIQGTLEITNPCYMRIGGTLGGTGIFSIGTESVPIPWQYDSNETVIIQITNAITAWIATSNVRLYGEERTNFHSFISSNAAVGTNIFWIYDPIDVRSNDVIAISAAYASGYESSTLAYVTNYQMATPPYYIVIGSNEFFTSLFASRQYSSVKFTNTTLRIKDYCGITVMSRNILFCTLPLQNNRSQFSYVHDGIAKGVRTLQSGAGFVSSGTNWLFTGCVAMNNGNGMYGVGGQNCQIYNCVSYGTAPLLRGSPNNIMTNCIVMNCQRGAGAYEYSSYNNIMSNSIIYNGYNGGFSYLSSGSYFYNCKSYFSNLGGFINYGSDNLFVNCEAYGCMNGGFSYIANGNTYIGCTSKSNTVAGFAYFGSGDTYIGCTAISNTTANYLNQSEYSTILNCTNYGIVPLILKGYGDSLRVDAWNIIEDSTSKVFYTKGGICTSQTDIVASPYGYTYKHMILDTGSENRWFESDMVRSYGSARWTVYMRMETSLIQRAYIAYEQGNYAANILAIVTNTASTGTWYTADLSWQNTSSIPVSVRLWLSAQGTSNDIAYSAAVKSDDQSLRIIP